MRVTLTDTKARQAKPPPTGRLDLWDSIVPGLSLRLTATGHRSWTVLSRLNGRVVRHTLGPYPALSLAAAREEARAALETMQAGRHPKWSRGTLFSAAWQLYTQQHRGSQSYKAAMASVYRLYLHPRFGSRPLADVGRAEVAELLTTLAVAKPIQANHLRSYLSTFMAWAAERGLIEGNPLAGLKPPAKKVSRDRVYSDPEVKAIWAACQGRYGALVKLMLATAQRRGHCHQIDWGQIDQERWVWTAPTKAGRLHPVPLSSLARELLGKPGVGRVWPYRVNWARLTEAIKGQPNVPPDFKLHDLRRTAATRMGELGVRREVISAVLDHSEAGVTWVYQRYQYIEEMRLALEGWAARLQAIVAP